MSSLPANGSPIWTLGRIAAEPSSKFALASTDAPPMPSRPVAEPNSTASEPGVGAMAREIPPSAHDADAHDVHQRVAGVRRVEGQLTTDGRYADAIPVATDSAHDAVHEPARAMVVRPAELQRIEQRNRSSAHRDDVAQDAADAGRGALVRLDRARVVVRLDLERHSQAVADAHDAGVFARAGEHIAAGCGQRPQERFRTLVRAVLAPHDAEHGQLEIVRRAVEQSVDLHRARGPSGQGARWQSHGRPALSATVTRRSLDPGHALDE